MATAAGSSAYHWAPHNASLAFDRLPIAWACAALLCAFLAERRDARWARPAVLAAALALASASVALWWGSELAGRSDLRAYLFVQFLPMLIVPAALLMRLPRQGSFSRARQRLVGRARRLCASPRASSWPTTPCWTRWAAGSAATRSSTWRPRGGGAGSCTPCSALAAQLR